MITLDKYDETPPQQGYKLLRVLCDVSIQGIGKVYRLRKEDVAYVEDRVADFLLSREYTVLINLEKGDLE